MPARPIIASTIRSGLVESVYRGSVLLEAPDGSAIVRCGSTSDPVFPRSVNKPFQSVAMIRAGLPLTGELLALATASHRGEPFHVDGVRRILEMAEMAEGDLQCPPDIPADPVAAKNFARADLAPSPLYMNCSGQHAAMLLTCTINGWPSQSYTDPDHRLQVSIRQEIERQAAERVTTIGIDYCGAALFAVTLQGIARGFRSLTEASPATPERQVVDTMRSYPQWTSGTSGMAAMLMEAVPGLLVKNGAEGNLVLVHGSGHIAVVKMEDGADRPLGPVAVALLRAIGVELPALEALSAISVTGGGQAVGSLRAIDFTELRLDAGQALDPA